MKKSDIISMPAFFDKYINQVLENDLFIAFLDSQKAIESLDMEMLKKIGNKTYQTGKWTLNDIFQHIVDNERIQSYRAMRFSRKDSTILPGYDEQLLGANANADKRKLEDIIEELKTVRLSTIQLFKSFDDNAFQYSGICFNQNVSVLALGFNIIGHQIHHLKVVKEKYLPLEG
jgi:hypothetical protein